MRKFEREILPKIKDLDINLERLRLKEVSLFASGEASFEFICDNAVDDRTSNKIRDILKLYLPESFTKCSVEVKKIIADPELVKNEIFRYLSDGFMSVAHSISLDDIRVNRPIDGVCEYYLDLEEDVSDYVEQNAVVDKLSEHLCGEFCCRFVGKANAAKKERFDADILKGKINPSDYETIKPRTLKVGDPVKLWGEDIEGTALYIADATLASGICCFSGVVESISTRETKTGKTFYLVELNDMTGKLVGKIFTTVEKLKKIDKIQVGTQLICRGELGSFNGSPSFKINDVSFCSFPSDFKPEERASKSVPEFYTLVAPEKIEDMSQSFLFDADKSVPECLIGKRFTVVDIETTGLSYVNGDKITEIGAVRIVDGKIVDKFQTLINPEKPISEQITELTGIDNEMVADKPIIDKVIPDFFKYAADSVIVGHNLDFDYQFISYYAKKVGYTFTNKGMDTCALSREVNPRLKNHKLNTACEKYGIEFLHHRALSDAHATAKLFIELIRDRGSLPE